MLKNPAIAGFFLSKFQYDKLFSKNFTGAAMKLSRAGWNNVIIFSVMTFILLINMTNQQLFSSGGDDGQAENYLFGEHAIILTLSIPQQLLVERIGRTWRATPAKISGQLLEQMMLSWHESQGQVMTSTPKVDPTMALLIRVELAGESQPQDLSFYTSDTELLVYAHQQKRWLSFPLAIFQQLLPNEILAA